MGPDLGGGWEGVDKRLPYPSSTVVHANKELYRLPIEGSHAGYLAILNCEKMMVPKAFIPEP